MTNDIDHILSGVGRSGGQQNHKLAAIFVTLGQRNGPSAPAVVILVALLRGSRGTECEMPFWVEISGRGWSWVGALPTCRMQMWG